MSLSEFHEGFLRILYGLTSVLQAFQRGSRGSTRVLSRILGSQRHSEPELLKLKRALNPKP